MSEYTLSVADYVVFVLVLALSSLIGIYFARRDTTRNDKNNEESNGDEKEKIISSAGSNGREQSKNKETDEYLVGGRNMHWFPLSISFMATYISASALLGIPAEVYTFGFQYIISCCALLVSTFFTWTIFIPIFYRLKIVCANEVRADFFRFVYPFFFLLFQRSFSFYVDWNHFWAII